MINAAVPPTPKPTSSNLEKPIAQVAVRGENTVDDARLHHAASEQSKPIRPEQRPHE